MYIVLFAEKAKENLDKLGNVMKKRVLAKLRNNLASTSDPTNGPNIKTMQGQHGLYRYRVADVRIIYEVRHKELVIWVVDVGYRGKIYRR
jgi:mRNA interferase RelE/StbE